LYDFQRTLSRKEVSLAKKYSEIERTLNKAYSSLEQLSADTSKAEEHFVKSGILLKRYKAMLQDLKDTKSIKYTELDSSRETAVSEPGNMDYIGIEKEIREIDADTIKIQRNMGQVAALMQADKASLNIYAASEVRTRKVIKFGTDVAQKALLRLTNVQTLQKLDLTPDKAIGLYRIAELEGSKIESMLGEYVKNLDEQGTALDKTKSDGSLDISGMIPNAEQLEQSRKELDSVDDSNILAAETLFEDHFKSKRS